MRIAVAGTGYVGLVTGTCLAEHGHSVICVDVDEKKVELMRQGISPIYEPGLSELLVKNLDRLEFTTDFVQAYKNAEVIFIGVGTPQKKDGSANLKYVFEVTEQIAKYAEKNPVVVVKSTVPIGTNDKIEMLLNEAADPGKKFKVVSNPEFLAQGTAVRDTMHASRIVIGTEDKEAEAVMRQVYHGFDAPIVVAGRRSAEMIKYACNDFLALKISFINEIANLCELVGADVEDVARGMGLDQRIGNQFLKAGIGYGGSCFPKDTKALHWLANFHDYEIKTIKAAIEVNEQQKLRLYKKARRYYSSLSGLTVAVLGLTFKPNTDDMREAPSLVNIPLIIDDGAYVKAYDPIGVPNFRCAVENSKEIEKNIQYCETIADALRDADICFIFTEWEEIRNLRAEDFMIMKNPIVLDGRNCFDPEEMSGIIYDGIGRANYICRKNGIAEEL